MIKHEPLGSEELPRPGTLVAIDAEFVQMQQEETEYRSDGTKKVLRPARLSLARVSVLRGDGPKQGVPFIDDHIHTSEIIVDYLTEFSGIRCKPIFSSNLYLSLKSPSWRPRPAHLAVHTNSAESRVQEVTSAS